MHEPTQEPGASVFPSIDTISSIYDEVLIHNRENTGLGAGFKALFGAIVESAEPIELNEGDALSTATNSITGKVNDQMRQSAEEGELQGDLVAWSADGPMSDIGLRINASGTYLAVGSINGQEKERASASALEPWLDSPTKFAGFLGTLDRDSVAENVPIRKLTTDVLVGLTKTINLAYRPSPEQLLVSSSELAEAGEAQLRAFATIAGAYEDLGLADTEEFERLAEYTRRWGEGVLPDYLIAEEKAYLSPDIQGFGPSKWQTDMVPGKFEERWDEAMRFVEYLLQDSQKQAFGLEVKASLEASLEDVKAWAENPPTHYNEEYMNNILPAIKRVLDRFSQQHQ